MTPGPWGVRPEGNGNYEVGHGGTWVARVHFRDHTPEGRAEALENANAIAAAPELIDALMQYRLQHESRLSLETGRVGCDCSACRLAVAVLAKARP